MSIAQYLRAGVPITDPDNKLPSFNPNDSIIDEGFEFLFDTRRLASYASQTDPENLQVIKNLVPGKPDAVIRKTGQGITFTQKGIYLPGIAGNFIQIGAPEDFKLAAMTPANPDVLFLIWFNKLNNTVYGNYPSILSRKTGANANSYEVDINGGNDCNTVSASFSSGSAINGFTLGAGAVLDAYKAKSGTFVQVGLAMEGNRAKLFIDGQLIGTSTVDFTKPYWNPTNVPLYLGVGTSTLFKGIIKRWGMATLGHGKTAAQIIAQDFADNKVGLNS